MPLDHIAREGGCLKPPLCHICQDSAERLFCIGRQQSDRGHYELEVIDVDPERIKIILIVKLHNHGIAPIQFFPEPADHVLFALDESPEFIHCTDGSYPILTAFCKGKDNPRQVSVIHPVERAQKISIQTD